jgi:hypothetical protein
MKMRRVAQMVYPGHYQETEPPCLQKKQDDSRDWLALFERSRMPGIKPSESGLGAAQVPPLRPVAPKVSVERSTFFSRSRMWESETSSGFP